MLKLFKRHKIKVIHFDYGIHSVVVRHYKYKTLKAACTACEYISKYHNTICVVEK